MHRVHIHLRENGGGCRDGWREKDVLGLAELAKVASAHKPDDVARKLGPPEVFVDDGASHVKALVTEVVVCRSKGRKSFIV